MVHRQDGEYDVECLVLKGQRLGNRSHCRPGRRRALTEHYSRGVDSDNSASNGFVGTGSGTDIEDGGIGADQRVKSRG
jgi:hypothetical protein